MPFSICTWNINSVRLRLDLVLRLLGEWTPDVLCLQETKCPNELFPREAFEAAGYPHIALHGQKGYHGVAVISRHPFHTIERLEFGGEPHARHISVVFDGGPAKDLCLHNFYIPAGGDIPDPDVNPKFAHKLAYLSELRAWKLRNPPKRAIMVGDLNIAPLPDDVWDHKKMLKVVSHTPIEVEHLNGVLTDGGWVDVVRERLPVPERVYTWWSYRASDWRGADRGRRLDHIWASPDVSPHVEEVRILKDARGWDRPSDHVPLMAIMNF